MDMLEKHAKLHLDRLVFPNKANHDYILERGKYTKMAYGRLGKNWQNAEDAVQEAYLSIMEYPPPYHMNMEQFEAYFTTVLNGVIGKMFRTERNQEVNHVAPDGKYLQYDEDDDDENHTIVLPDIDSNPEDAALTGEVEKKVRAEIDKLKPIPRTIAAMSILYGYKPREIMAITGDKPMLVYNTIKNFRKKMQEVLLDESR